MRRRKRPIARRLPAILAAVALLGTGVGCAEIEAADAEQYQPASLSAADEGGIKAVRLTEIAADRVGLATETVKARGLQRQLPYEALIYDGSGDTWVYAEVDRLTYKRTPVTVDTIEDAAVVLSAGPSVGTPVVTRGSTQVYGAELGMAGKH